MNYTYQGSICSDLELVKGFVENILRELSKMIDSEDIMFEIRLILNELILNGIFHGNKHVESKQVKIAIKIDEYKIIINVKDEGAGIQHDFKSYDPMELKCKGRGLILVEGLSDELILNKNKVTAIKYLPKYDLL